MSAASIERFLWVLFAAFMIAVPWLIPALINAFWVSVIAEILIWSLFAASVNLLFGYVGLLSFGQALYFGFGMYGVAIGIQDLGLSFWPAFGLGIVASMAMALVTGIFAGNARELSLASTARIAPTPRPTGPMWTMRRRTRGARCTPSGRPGISCATGRSNW